MKNKSVLIISHEQDGGAQMVMKQLTEIGQEFHLIDFSLFPDELQSTINYSDGGGISFGNKNGILFSNDTVKSVWWRRPKGKFRQLTSDPVRKYIESESEVCVSALASLLDNDVLWVSRPEKTVSANNKPLQLKLAKKIGFRIPKTIITNNPTDVRIFMESNLDLPLIMKPVGTSFVRLSPEFSQEDNLAIYTKVIDREQILKNLNMVQNCPVIFQEAAMQDFDIRVIVVGDSVFSVKIGHSEDLGAGQLNLDWRHHKLRRTHEKYFLPKELEHMCVQLTKDLGLNFGAIDMCFSKEKGYIFFEINPQGQWVPAETVARFPISNALARFLARC